MRTLPLLLLLCAVSVLGTGTDSFDLHSIVHFAESQYNKVTEQLHLGHEYPTDGFLNSSRWHVSTDKHRSWTDGFFPGVLWQLYNFTKHDSWKMRAINATDGMYDLQFSTGSHDVGFIIMSSYGDGFALTGNKSYPDIIVNAAKHLSMRFNDKVGCIRSWGNINDRKHFLVIVDNMMNLELLFKAYQLSKNQTYYDMAVSHANCTIREHLRKDYSSYHVVDFDQMTGKPIKKYTAQGYSDSSCWSRGQAWLLTGFTQAYGYTKMGHFLYTAQHVAKYFINHLPDDAIPPWDFSVLHDGKQAYIPRDTSAAAIASFGLFQLYGYTGNRLYLDTAHRIVTSLSSKKYLVDGNVANKLPALVANSTIMGPNADPAKSDLALIYTDYYYLKSLSYLQQYHNKSNQNTPDLQNKM